MLNRLNLQGKAGNPLGHAIALSQAPDASVCAPQGANSRLAQTLVLVVNELKKLGDRRLEVGEVLAAGVCDNVAVHLGGDLLLHGNGGNANVIPVILVHGRLIQVAASIVVLVAGSNKVGSVDASELISLLLVQALLEALDGARKILGEALLVDAGHGAPQDVAGLAEARMVKVKRFFGSLHQGQNVRLEGLAANRRGELAHGVADDTAQVEVILAVLDADILGEGVHGLLKVGDESLLGGGSNGANGTNGSTLALEVLVLEELAEAGHELADILGSLLGLKTLDQGVNGVAGAADNLESALVIRVRLQVLDGEIEVLQHGGNQAGVLTTNVLGKIIGQASDTIQRGAADLQLGILQKVQDQGHDLMQLGSDEIGGALDAHAQSKDTGLAVIGVLGVEVLAESLHQRNNDLAGRQAGGQNIEQAKGRASGRHILVVAGKVAQLSDNLEGLEGHLFANAQTLDLELAVADALHQVGESLGAVVVVDGGGARQLKHELDQVTEVLLQQSRLAAQERLEDLEGLQSMVLVAVVDKLLQDIDHGGNRVLELGEGLRVLLGVQKHGEAAQTKHRVDADLGTLGVLDGVIEQLVQLSDLAGVGIADGLERGPHDEGADLAVADVGRGACLLEEAGQVSPLAVFEVDGGNGRDNTGGGVAGEGGIVVKRRLEELIAQRNLLVLGETGPVPANELAGLDGGELTQLRLRVAAYDLEQRIERRGRGIVLLVERCGGRLDTLRVGWAV